MARKPPSGNNVRALMSIQSPGAYEYVVRGKVERELFDGDAALSDLKGDALTQHELGHAARVTAEVDQRLAAGEPVGCQAWELPRGLPTPFHRWPVAGRTFTVTDDDRITLRRKESK